MKKSYGTFSSAYKPLGAAIFLAVCFLLIFTSAYLIGQHDNLSALINGFKYSGSQLEEKISDNKAQLTEVLEQYNGITVRSPTEEERNKIYSGTLTDEELDELVSGMVSGGDGSEAEEYGLLISGCIARLYILQAQFVSQIEALSDKTIADYVALPPEERNESAKASLVAEATAELSEMEKDCDQKLNAIIAEMDKLLTMTGSDTSLVTAVKTYYVNEKAYMKAYYLNKYIN